MRYLRCGIWGFDGLLRKGRVIDQMEMGTWQWLARILAGKDSSHAILSSSRALFGPLVFEEIEEI